MRQTRAISVFHDTGLLTRLIPEFKDITYLTQFDMFHRYSTDEHTLTALRVFENIPRVTDVSQRVKDVFRLVHSPETVKLAL